MKKTVTTSQFLEQRLTDIPTDIADQIRHVAGTPVAFIAVIAAGASAIASLVWRHHMEACLRKCRELMPRTVSQFWEAVKQKQQRFAGTAGGDLSGLQQMHLQAG